MAAPAQPVTTRWPLRLRSFLEKGQNVPAPQGSLGGMSSYRQAEAQHTGGVGERRVVQRHGLPVSSRIPLSNPGTNTAAPSHLYLFRIGRGWGWAPWSGSPCHPCPGRGFPSQEAACSWQLSDSGRWQPLALPG